MKSKLPPQMSFFKLVFCTLALVGTITTQISAQSSANSNNITIVIDPGHGGKDNGCSVDGHNEKDIALKLALKIGDAIYEQSENVNIIFTRTEDEFIPLHSRSHLANSLEADIFISIHANSYKSAKVKGSEVYVLGVNKNEDNSNLAKRENASLLFESESSQEEYRKLYESPEGHILLSSISNDYLDKSILLASTIENELIKIKGHKSLGVKQASFSVLRNTHMPSILFEVGFMTNKEDLARMLNNLELDKISHQFAKALLKYVNENGEKKELNSIVSQLEPKRQITKSEMASQPIAKSHSTPQQKQKITQEIVEKYSKKKPKKEVIQNHKPIHSTKADKEKNKDKFSLQVATSYSNNLQLNLDRLKSKKNVFVVKEDDLFVYYLAYYKSLETANLDRLILIDSGYKGTFITKKVFTEISDNTDTQKDKKSYNIISY